jgi:beta-galactosidase
VAGRWTWTGHDYRGEPSPYNWPDVNSHFGIVDLAGFEKDRFYWYQSWFLPNVTNLYLFPHWK